MRLPSVKTLSAVFENAKEARRILEMARFELLELPSVIKVHDKCYNQPGTEYLRQSALDALEEGLFGIEAIQVGDEYADYLNTGDTYAPTLIYWRGSYRVQSVGDFVETLERNGVRVD